MEKKLSNFSNKSSIRNIIDNKIDSNTFHHSENNTNSTESQNTNSLNNKSLLHHENRPFMNRKIHVSDQQLNSVMSSLKNEKNSNIDNNNNNSTSTRFNVSLPTNDQSNYSNKTSNRQYRNNNYQPNFNDSTYQTNYNTGNTNFSNNQNSCYFNNNYQNNIYNSNSNICEEFIRNKENYHLNGDYVHNKINNKIGNKNYGNKNKANINNVKINIESSENISKIEKNGANNFYDDVQSSSADSSLVDNSGQQADKVSSGRNLISIIHAERGAESRNLMMNIINNEKGLNSINNSSHHTPSANVNSNTYTGQNANSAFNYMFPINNSRDYNKEDYRINSLNNSLKENLGVNLKYSSFNNPPVFYNNDVGFSQPNLISNSYPPSSYIQNNYNNFRFANRDDSRMFNRNNNFNNNKKHIVRKNENYSVNLNNNTNPNYSQNLNTNSMPNSQRFKNYNRKFTYNNNGVNNSKFYNNNNSLNYNLPDRNNAINSSNQCQNNQGLKFTLTNNTQKILDKYRRNYFYSNNLHPSNSNSYINSIHNVNNNYEILLVNIKLNNELKTIKLNKYDEPHESAKDFCKLNNLPEKLIKPISIKINSAINSINGVLNSNLPNKDIDYLKSLNKLWKDQDWGTNEENDNSNKIISTNETLETRSESNEISINNISSISIVSQDSEEDSKINNSF